MTPPHRRTSSLLHQGIKPSISSCRTSSDLTVLLVLLLCVSLFVPALALCRRADGASEQNLRVQFLPDNSPSEPYLYAVSVHTGLRSAACISSKVPPKLLIGLLHLLTESSFIITCSSGLRSSVRGRRRLTDEGTACPRMHSV